MPDIFLVPYESIQQSFYKCKIQIWLLLSNSDIHLESFYGT